MSVFPSMVAERKPVSELRAGCTPLVSNGHYELAATVKNVAQHVRKLESQVSNVQRKLSPIHQTTLDGNKPGTEKVESSVSVSVSKRSTSPRLNCKTANKEPCIRRLEFPVSPAQRVSPRIHNIPDDKEPDTLKLEPSISCLQRRVSPSSHCILDVKELESPISPVSPVFRRVSPRYQITLNDKKSDVENLESLVLTLHQRVSPRLQSILGDKKSITLACPEQRRVSPRLQSIPDNKKPNYGSSCKRKQDVKNDMGCNKKNKVKHSGGGHPLDASEANAKEEDKSDENGGNVMEKDICDAKVSLFDEADGIAKWLAPSSLIDKHGVSFTAKVKETLRLFNLHYLHFVQEEEKRYKKIQEEEKRYKMTKEEEKRCKKKEVVHYWAEKGVAGFTVFKYRLKRLLGKPPFVTNQVHFTSGRGSKVQSELRGVVCKDICNGQENVCIPATNVIDVPPVAPEGFTYINSVQVASNLNIPLDACGCNCKGNCTDPKICSCTQLNGLDFPYVRRDGGRLIEASDVVFECGPNCGCGATCLNRTSQRGLKYRLEVYRTPNKGWAVRSWDFIPSGAPVCEYTGVLKKSDELDNISENDYIFEIDCWQTINGMGGRERRLRDVSLPSNHSDKRDDRTESFPEFCIDAGSLGNVARFINHSCEPNLFVQCVLSSHHDIRLARVVLFAADNIPPLQELTYDYGYELDSVIGPDGKVKRLPCYCGAVGCRKRLY